jgi:2-dehydro-3-deoxygluconokinase
LARFGLDSHFMTRLPANAVGDAALRALRGEGVHLESVIRGGERIGIYFAESGAGVRPSMVVYDRAPSALSELEPSQVAWSELLSGVAWFHTTGITPALGPRAAACTLAALEAARTAGARVSMDLNYRHALWSEAEARQALRPLMRHIDVLIANEHQLDLLGVSGIERVAAEFDIERVALTVRESLSASENGWSGLLYDRSTRSIHRAPRYRLRLVDRIGGGDGFAAGLIFALLDGRPPLQALAFAVAAGALKQTIPGDFNRVSVAEVERLASGDESGRIRR